MWPVEYVNRVILFIVIHSYDQLREITLLPNDHSGICNALLGFSILPVPKLILGYAFGHPTVLTKQVINSSQSTINTTWTNLSRCNKFFLNMNKFMVDWANNLNKQLNISFMSFVLFLLKLFLVKKPYNFKKQKTKNIWS